jgi:hypothetical protein
MKVNFKKIEQTTGLKFENLEQLYFRVLYVLEFLKVHNKNYTKRQYEKIDELFEFIRSVEFTEGSDSE